MDKRLLDEFAARMPFRPSVALLRAIELEFVSQWNLPTGFGIDVGCGDGVVTSVLLARTFPRLDWKLVGIDPNPFEARLARESGCYVRVHVTGAEAIPEEDATFDFAFSNSVFEHIPDVDPCLAEIARVLKDHGRLVFTVPSEHWRSALAGLGLIGRALGIDRRAYLEFYDAYTAHYRYWSLEEWQQHLDQAGFQILAVGRYLTPKELRRMEIISNLTGGLFFQLFGRTKRPVEIQRLMGMRRSHYPAHFKWVSKVILRAIAFGLSPRLGDEKMYCCYLVDTVKR